MDADKAKGERLEVIWANPETGEVDVEEAAQRAAEWAAALVRVGGAVTMGADREELLNDRGERTGLFVTSRIVIRWNSYVPGRRAQAEAVTEGPVEVPDVEPDDRAAEPAAA